MKKVLLTFVAVLTLTLAFCFGVSAEASGSCGDNVTYTYNSTTKELVISGTGAMENYYSPPVYYEYGDKKLNRSPFYNSDIKSVVIKSGVTTIGDYAFYNCKSLTNVTIPDSVTAIGDYVFYNCKSLTSVTIPDSVTAIGSGIFFNTDYYNNVSNWDNSVLYIGNYLIDSKSSITSCDIRQGTRIIAGTAFYGCTSLTNITIPDSVTIIASDAFRGCKSLTSVTVDKSNEYYSNDDYGVLFDKNEIELILYPAGNKRKTYTIPDSVTTIGDYAFSACTSLTNVTIPDSVTAIRDYAFYECNSLKDVYYCGTEEQWKKISVGLNNGSLTGATMHYNYCGSTHKNIVNISQENPTCTQIGYKAGKYCPDCKTWLEGHEKIPAINHKNATQHEQQNATCESIGYTAGVYCNDCKQWISGHEEIAKLGHSYSTEFTVDKKATYTQAGSKSKHCTRSGCTAKTSVTGIPKLILGTVQNFKATAKENSITLTWNKLDGATGYRIFRYSNGIWKTLKTTGTNTVITYTETGLSAATNYRFAVRAYVKEGSSVIWALKYPTISTATAPVPPLTVLQSAGTTNSVTIKWSVCQNTTGYRVFLYNASAKKWETAVAATTKHTSTVSGLKANSKYYVAVRPYTKTDSGYVWGTTYTKILVSTAPTAPTLKVLSSAKNRATIAWGKAAGATGYQVWYSTSPTSGYKKIANYTKNSTYQYNLTSGTTYYYRARAYKAVGGSYVYSAWSPVVSVKIK